MRPFPNHRLNGPAALPAILALALGLAASVPATAATALDSAAGDTPAAALPELVVAWQQSVFIGNIGVYDRWKCISGSSYGGTVYVATGRTESGTRAELAPYANGAISCRRHHVPRVF